MTTSPSSFARCAAYTADTSGQFIMPGVVTWLAGPDRPPSHGSIGVHGRRGIMYHVGTLCEESRQHKEWPSAVREWLQARAGTLNALIVVWE